LRLREVARIACTSATEDEIMPEVDVHADLDVSLLGIMDSIFTASWAKTDEAALSAWMDSLRITTTSTFSDALKKLGRHQRPVLFVSSRRRLCKCPTEKFKT
jgi:DNA topoisomerase IA